MMPVHDDVYLGNGSAFARLLETFENGKIAAFTGAGTSMPDMPSWSSLVQRLVNEAEVDGKLDRNIAEALKGDTDLLYVIDEIYSATGEAQTKIKVARIFNELKQPTLAHELLVETAFSRFLTLNYDGGLEMAHASQLGTHISSITAEQSSELDEWVRHQNDDVAANILHWHGRSSDSNSIILSGSDYSKFYDSEASRREALRNVFGTRQVLMVGFGFTDPFIERELGSVMRPFPKATNHFAIIGLPHGADQVLERRKYETKYKLDAIFYPVTKLADGRPDHSALLPVLKELQNCRPRLTSATPASGNTSVVIKARSAPAYRSNLFTIGDKQIYCEPNLWAVLTAGEAVAEHKVSLSAVVTGVNHCSIEAPNEYGLTNVGKKIAWELEVAGKSAIFRDAQGFPRHKKAILTDPDFIEIERDKPFTVLLDNFSVLDHNRCIRELISAFEQVRVIVLQRSNFSAALDDTLSELKFDAFQLRALSRQHIREVVHTVVPDYNSDVISTIVEKVYSDLLQLCIPLTPSNVIMYASVLCKDGSFSPVSRLHIVEKFTSEALIRASDAYADTFNAINKLDLISEFCYGLFSADQSTFNTVEWNNFCLKFKFDNLVEFNQSEILGDLINGRVVHREGQNLNFRYRMFFSYFVGRHIAAHPDLLKKCLEQNRHLELDGLVEVLCGTLHDGSEVLQDLTNKLSGSLNSFYEEYPISGLDLHQGAKWELTNKEEEVWASISNRMALGPASTQELDELKTSIHAERRTLDQKVSIIKFITSKESVVTTAWHLNAALENVKQATAVSKKEAAAAVIGANILAYEVATVFVPLIAERKYVSWSGFTYINLIEDTSGETEDADESRERMKSLVLLALPTSMARAAADTLGSRKLGQVFRALLEEEREISPIKRYILFCLLIRSKPQGWFIAVKKIISQTARDDIYLRHMLGAAMRQFRQEINTEDERIELKSLVAAIQLRRQVNVKSPSQTALNKSIKIMDKMSYWDEAPLDGQLEGDGSAATQE